MISMQKMDNPFSEKYDDSVDSELIESTLEGSRDALEQLIKRHQHFIYNIAFKMVLNPEDAEDITQEVLIIVITKLSQFKKQSKFRTWLYRIVTNYVLQMKKSEMEHEITNFGWYDRQFGELKDETINADEKLAYRDFIEETKLFCMAGMLLCLNREQRIIYILGELFHVNHTLGSEILEISKDNFRQKLTRAKKDLYQFMNNKCGLINKQNTCRCSKKTKALIEAGWVDKNTMQFNTSYRKNIYQTLNEKADNAIEILEDNYSYIFQTHPFQEKDHLQKLINIFSSKSGLTKTFNL